MFSVTSESSAKSPTRAEPPRLSAPDAPPRPNGFAALVDANARGSAEPPRSAPADRRDSAQTSARASRQDRDPPRDSAPNASADAPRNAESTAAPENSHQSAEKPSKQAQSEKTAVDSKDANSGKTSNTDTPTVSTSDVPQDSSAVVVAAVTAPPAAPTSAPAASPSTSGSATTAPLSIAAAAIAASAEASAMPTASGSETSPIVEAVAGAASEVNATNFTIAKTIATTLVPATELEAQPQPTAAPELASAVATAASKGIKSSDKLAVHTEVTADATPSNGASQPQAPTAAQPSLTTQAGPHQQDKANADATPAASPSQVDHPNGDSATPSTSGHHAATLASQTSTPDALSQLGATMTTPQTPAPTSIPAAQLTATAVTNLAVPVSGLALQIAASARAGNSRFEIRLDPAELGRIDIRLDVDRHGNVTSHLTVEKPETLAMLRQDAPQLQRSLEDAGLKTGQNGLQFSLRDQSSGQQNNEQTERQPQRLVISETHAAPLVAANTTYSYAAGASRGLDIRV